MGSKFAHFYFISYWLLKQLVTACTVVRVTWSVF